MDRTPMNAKRIIVIIGFVAAIVFLFAATLRQAHAAGADSTHSRLNEKENRISIVLSGVTDYDVTELFNDLVETAPGVIEAKRYRFSLYPDDPAACRIEWRVRLENTRPFDLESHLYTALQKIARSTDEAGAFALSRRPTDGQRELLGMIRPWQATSRKLSFRMLHFPVKNGNKHPEGIHATRRPDRGFD